MMRWLTLLLAIVGLGLLAAAGQAQEQLNVQAANQQFVPRKLLGLYDSTYDVNLRNNNIHRYYEMPANRLGFDLHYQDIHQTLPDLDDSYHGIVVFFTHDLPDDRVPSYMAWLEKQLKNGKRLLLVDNIGISNNDALDNASLDRLKYILQQIGVRYTGAWQPLTHKSQITYRDPKLVDFERKLVPPFAPFSITRAMHNGKSHLKMVVDPAEPSVYSDLIVTGPQGGYIASGYALHEQDVQERYVSAWYINPFEFLRAALLDGQVKYPVPDITTRVGRRIFYSHIDGDGWNNLTKIEQYRNSLTSSAQVIYERILREYPDFGFSVGLVAGDMVDSCFGSDKSRQTAKDIMALDNVEPTNHTYTHPLFWQFFEDYTEEKEIPYATEYPKRTGLFSQDFWTLIKSSTSKPELMREKDKATLKAISKKPDYEKTEQEQLLELYRVPRSYNCVPFDEKTEIVTATEIIEELSPPNKKVELLQWSGNTSPYEKFLRVTREAGLLNINGGESRFDEEYPSYSSLYPIGINIGRERQIYSTASNENTYTNLWSERFFGYRYLIQTVQHTEEPLRIAPFNVYFHSYSGERPASLLALEEILNYARTREVLPIHTSDFARLSNGFYTMQIEPLTAQAWRIHNRGILQTLRLDEAETLSVDYARSKGVLGQRRYQGNLYIFLNPSIDKPEIYLIPRAAQESFAIPVLMSSRWDVLDAARNADGGVALTVKGFGAGDMHWRVPENEKVYRVHLNKGQKDEAVMNVAVKNGKIAYRLNDRYATSPVDLLITPISALE